MNGASLSRLSVARRRHQADLSRRAPRVLVGEGRVSFGDGLPA